jgi:Spy/CpxP family protein refolding chaperone
MKSFRFRLSIAVLAILLGSAIARSQTTADTPPPPPGHGHEFGMGGPGPMMGFFAKQLNLTDEQKTQMKAIMQKEHPAVKPLMQQGHQIDQQLRQYVEGTYDAAKVQALAAQKAQIQVQLTVAETRIHNELYQTLTADQQSQFKQMEANHEARMQSRANQAPPPPAEQ